MQKENGAMAADDFTKTPEFAAAVAKAVASVVPGAVAEAIKGAALSRDSELDDQGATRFMRELAMTIAEISDQGTGRKRVAPEILARRAQAHDAMQKLRRETIDAYRDRSAQVGKQRAASEGYLPRYRIIATCALNEQIVQPFRRGDGKGEPAPNYIFWGGIPNLAMRPANEAAEKIFALFRESLGSSPKDAKVAQGGERVEDFWVTTGGNVIRGPKPQAQYAAAEIHADEVQLARIEEDAFFADDLGIPQGNDPFAESINVLGTLAEPARQLNAGVPSVERGRH